MRLLAEYIRGIVMWDRIGVIRYFPVRQIVVRPFPVTLWTVSLWYMLQNVIKQRTSWGYNNGRHSMYYCTVIENMHLNAEVCDLILIFEIL